jgi:integrase
MGIYRRGRTWWMSFSVNGRQVRKSTGTDNKELAKKIYYKAVTLITEGRWFETQKAKTILFKELVEKYMATHAKSRDHYTVKRLLPEFGHLALSEITTELAAEYRSKRLKEVKPATVYQELSLMRRMFNVARKEWKWVKDNPVADLSFSVGNSNARDRWLTIEEENRLLSCAERPRWLKPLLIVALHTGMRKGEILNLRWQDIDFTRKTLTVQRSKNGQKRGIPMSELLTNTLKEFRQNTKVIDISGRVFPISDRSLRVAFAKALKKAGIQDFKFHDLRHTFATRLVQAGVDLYTVQQLLGHKTIAMTMRYSHHCPESLRPGITVLDNLSQFYHNQAVSRSSGSGQNP